jgi:hypothetical protein
MLQKIVFSYEGSGDVWSDDEVEAELAVTRLPEKRYRGVISQTSACSASRRKHRHKTLTMQQI